MNSSSVNNALALTFSYFQLVATVLERFVSRGEQTLSFTDLARELSLGIDDVEDVCECLTAAGVITHGSEPGQWLLAMAPAEITLEDVWRAIGGTGNAGAMECIEGERTSTFKVGLLTTQALIGLDQSIASHLRRFRLDCVEASRPQLVYFNKRHGYQPDVDVLETA